MSTATPCLETIYELKFRKMQQNPCDGGQNDVVIMKNYEPATEHSHKHMVQEITDIMEACPVVSASENDHPIPLQMNIPLKSPLQTLHNLVTHNMAPGELALMEQQ